MPRCTIEAIASSSGVMPNWLESISLRRRVKASRIALPQISAEMHLLGSERH